MSPAGRPRDPLILTIDLGTSSCKATLFDSGGALQARVAEPYPSTHPHPGWAEQSPADWWAAAVSAVRSALAKMDNAPARVAGIGVTGQMHGILPIDGEGQPLGGCLTLHDRRAEGQAERILAEVGAERLYRISGAPLSPAMPLAKICWIREEQPELYARTRAFLPPKDYLRFRLTGELSTESIDAAGTLLYDLCRGDWSDELLAAGRVERDKLPPIAPAWEPAGPLSAEAAKQMGLPAGLPVVRGAGDDIEVLGLGLTAPGRSLEHIGTTGSIMSCVAEPVFDPSMTIELYPHVDPGLWLIGGSVNQAGGALAWAQEVLAMEEAGGPWAGVDPRNPTAGWIRRPILFLPYLSGERCPIWNPAARGAWLGLDAGHRGADLLRAAAEGVVFSLRHVLEKIESVTQPIESIAVSDAQDDLWLTIRASIYNRRLHVMAAPEPSALGSAILAGVGIGLYRDVRDGVSKTVAAGRPVSPQPAWAGDYERLYRLYGEASSCTAPLFSRLVGEG